MNKIIITLFVFTLLISCNSNEFAPHGDTAKLELLYPIGGEQIILSNKAIEIQWESINIDSINIYIKEAQDTSWTIIAESIASNLEAFLWQPPNKLSQQYILKIVNLKENLSDETSVSFTVAVSNENINKINYYPLNVGDTWIYEIMFIPNWDPINNDTTLYLLRREVVEDSTGQNGDLFWKILEDSSYHYEKVDYKTGEVTKLDQDVNSGEVVIYNLFKQEGEEFMSQRFYSIYYVNTEFVGSKLREYFGIHRNVREYREISEYAFCNYELIDGIGLGKYNQGLAPSVRIGKLKGCIIDGELYGDTAITK